MARVLVVEDDDDVREVVTRFLNREGHETERWPPPVRRPSFV
jgi:CheY-like chemotaxis protein